MSPTKLTTLKRRHVDEMMMPFVGLRFQAPKVGWIRTIRTALGMTMPQLGNRLGRTTKQAVEQLEKNEVNGSLTLAKLRSAAEALDCEVIIAFRPKAGSIENAVKQQAMRKAREMHSTVLHTMALEAQSEGLEAAPELLPEAQWWLTQNAARLWD